MCVIRVIHHSMKICPYCGKQYPDDALLCSIDRQPLEGIAESPQRISKAPVPKVQCPACGASDDYTAAIELRSSFSWPVFFAGGIWAVLFRNAGRRRKVRCNRCETRFYIRTPLSKISLVLFWILICPTIVILVVFFVALLDSISSVE